MKAMKFGPKGGRINEVTLQSSFSKIKLIH